MESGAEACCRGLSRKQVRRESRPASEVSELSLLTTEDTATPEQRKGEEGEREQSKYGSSKSVEDLASRNGQSYK